MRPSTILPLAFCLATPVLGLTVYHRIDDQPFTVRGQLQLSRDEIHFHPEDSLATDLAQFATKPNSVYQVALAREHDQSQAEWAVSHVKACFLQGMTTEHLIFHISDPSTFSPFAFDYFVDPVPRDGSCPTGQPSSPFNTTVSVRPSRLPPLPELKTPLPLTAEGEVVAPVPEQPFFQKYWMYIAAFLLVFLITGPAPPDEEPKK